MNRINLALVCFIVLAGMAFADIQVSSVSVSPTTPRPGNSGSVSFTLTNNGASGISGLVLYPTGYGFEFSSDKISVGNIGASGSTTVNIPFRVPASADSGVYTLMVNAYWNDNTVSGSTGNKLIQIPVTISKQTLFKIYSSAVDVSIGGEFKLKAQLENTGGRAKNVVLAMSSAYFVATDGTSLVLGDIRAGEKVDFEVPISTSQSMPAGAYSVPITISYQDEFGTIQQTTATLGTVQAVKGFVDFTITPSLEPASPGKKIKMMLTARNDGTLSANTVRCSVSSSSAYFLPIGSSQKLLGNVLPGETVSTSYDLSISAGATPGYYPVIITFDYLNRQGEAQASISKTIGVEVVGTPKLTVITSTNPSPVLPGGKYSLSVQVSNVGTTDLKSLIVHVEGDSFTVVDNSASTFIGNLKTDDYSQVSYNVIVGKGVTPGKHPVTVKMTFMDSYNNEQTVVATSELQVVTAEVAMAIANGKGGGMDLGTILVLLVVVVVIAYFGYRKFFKKNNGKK